jgi:hypothetical protein
MTFTIKERLILSQILRQARGGFTALRLLRKFMEALSFSEEEHAQLHFVESGEQVSWNPKVTIEKDIEVGPAVMEIVKNTLKALESSPTPPDFELLAIYDKFNPEEN